MKFRVVLGRWRWRRCLEDLSACLAAALRRAGHDVEETDVFRGRAEIEIVLGAHEPLVVLPDYPVVIYQTEVPSSGWFTGGYRHRLNNALAIWEASADFVPADGTNRVSVLEPGLVDTKAEPLDKTIDVLFYGSLSERRIKILQKLTDAGIRAEAHFGVFGAERNRLIDQAKVVVDIKQHDGDPNDKTRTFFLDSRGACVLSENDANERRALRPESIVIQCRQLLADEQARAVHAASRRAELKPMDVTAAVQQLGQLLSRTRPLGQTNGSAHHLA